MLEFRELQAKMQMELILYYHYAVRNCKNKDDLFQVVKLHVNKALELIKPDHVVTIKPKSGA